ncbi:DUF6599 family protein [Acidobacteriota bacterium]
MTESKPTLPKTVGLWTRPESPQIITAENIFDYMNGAGELYVGYCFDHLEAYEYAAEDQKEILVEIYFMKTSDDAFGLLSLDWGGEPLDLNQATLEKSPSVQSEWPRALYGKGLLRLWSDSIYARIMAYQETPESREAVLAIGQIIAKDGMNSPSPELMKSPPDAFQSEWKLIKDRVSFFRTHLVLNSLYYLGHENMLDLDHASEAVTASYEKKDSSGSRSRIRFLKVKYPDPNKAHNALAHFHKSYLPEHTFPEKAVSGQEIVNTYPIEDGWLGYKLQDDTLTFIFECPDQETARTIIQQVK